jgi:hypothetical protein
LSLKFVATSSHFEIIFLASARRPFPSILDDLSDELLDLNSALTSGSDLNPEMTSVMTEKLNTNAYPILVPMS